MSRSRVTSVLIPVALVVFAAIIRLVLLGHPDRIIFDETYYVNDARAYLDQGVETGFAVHPPVGKWLIAAGIALLGDDPVGWRISTAVAGVLLVLLTYLIGVRLLRWRGAAALAALLVAVDGLLFVQSRTSMLDVFLGLFVALGAWLLLVDLDASRLDEGREQLEPRRRSGEDASARQGQLPLPAGGSSDEPPAWWTTSDDDVRARDPAPWEERTAAGDGDPDALSAPAPAGPLRDLPVRSHGLRLLAGAAFGLAIATKWSGVLALAAAALITLGWELAWRRRLTGRFRIRLLELVGSLALAFVLVPLAVYAASYIPWLANYGDTTEGQEACPEDGPCQVGIPARVAGLLRYQVDIYNFHADLEADHPYRAPARTWPVIGRPVVYYWEDCDANRANGVATTNDEGEVEEPEPCVVEQGNAGEIIAMGNPGIWWVALAALVPLGAGAILRDRRAWFVLGFWGLQFLPWLLVDRPVFFFYMTPVVAFLALGIAYGVTWLDELLELRGSDGRVTWARGRLTPGAIAGVVVATVAVGMFLYFYPVLSGIELDRDVVSQRWWFESWV